MFKFKVISALDKALPGDNFDNFKEANRLSALRGETVSFQLLYTMGKMESGNFSTYVDMTMSGSLKDFAKVREVLPVPALFTGRGNPDSDYITTSPTLMPDILSPVFYNGRLVTVPNVLKTLWIDIEIPKEGELGFTEGTLELTLNYTPSNPSEKSYEYKKSLFVEVIEAPLPESTLIFTQWFHHDCLANYYKVEKWSEEHFRIIENFVATAARGGINMLLTPIITPPLDNIYDTRDLQLADVKVNDSGEYEFSFDKLGRWIDICQRHGIKYFEIGHLFTQGGAARATKVSGIKDGKYQRLFPTDTPCDDPEYVRFLRALLKSLIAYMKARGDDKRMSFHISDEPSDVQLEVYNKAKSAVADILENYPVMDALSHYEFYEKGVVKKPVVILHHLADFIEHNVEGLWTYNCCAPDAGYSNRFLSMTLSRNRSISLLLYKFNIEGFLHWGYNFYNNAGSANPINPFLDTSSGGIFPAGDAFSVYPAEDGTALESMRFVTFREGLDDLAAYRLCESLYSRDEVISALENFLGEEIKTTTYINDSQKMTALREHINKMIKAKL